MPDRIKLILVRHGEPASLGKEKFSAGLTKKGKQDASITGDFLATDRSIKKVFTSSLERARQTAEIISRRVRTPLKVVPELQEVHLGEWEGRETDEIRRDNPEFLESFRIYPEEFQIPKDRQLLAFRDLEFFRIYPEEFQIPKGEKLSVFLRRIKAGLRYVLSEIGSGTAVIVVTCPPDIDPVFEV